tara:strand:- start:536 stop:6991 length:6456 start_codon:yes stop_codon:yes gene_type:complete
MTIGIIEPRVTLQSYFETADVPTEIQFANFLYSYFHLSDLNIGNLWIQGNITASGAISASLGGYFGSLTSPLGASTDDSVVILTSANELKTDEIDTRVWNVSTTGNTTDHLFGGNPSSLTTRYVPYISNIGPNTLLNSVIYQSNSDEIGIGTGVSADFPAMLTVSGSIYASGSNGSITASKNISASLGVYAREYYVYDKLTLGRSADKTHIVIGGIGTGWQGISTVLPITASATISASGYVTAYNITSSNNISASGYLSASSGDFADGNITNVRSIFLDTIEADDGTNITIGDLNDDLRINADVTASQNISASGWLHGSRLLIQGWAGTHTPYINYIVDPESSNDVVLSIGTKTPPNGYEFIVVGNTSMSNDLSIGADIEKVINITASGDLMVRNVSASGNITASGFISASAGDFADGNITNVGVMYADGVYADYREIQIGNDTREQNILLSGPVTASSHISASMPSGSHIIGGKSIHFITPAITASKPFSGSGYQNIVGNNVTLGDACSDSIYIKGALTASCGTILGEDCSDSIEIKGTVTASCDISSSADLIVREITASGNISSSATVIAKAVQTSRIQGHNEVTYLHYDGGGGVPGQNLKIYGGVDQDVIVYSQLQVLDDFHVTGSISASGTSVSHIIGGKNFHFKTPHITASYNFSGSGQNNILGNNVTLGDECSDSIYIKGALTASCGTILGEDCSDSIEIKGTVTASCDISSSADLIVRSITASAGISASGKLFAYGADFANQDVNNIGGIYVDTVFPDGDHLSNGRRKLVIGTSASNGGDIVHIFGALTASLPGNISASGYLSASSADFSDGDITNVGKISLDSVLPDNNVNIQIGNSANHDIKIVGDITASYNFSGSGQNNIIGNNVTLGDSCSDDINILGTITSSCNISSSANIYGLSGSFHHLNVIDDIVLGSDCSDSITLAGTTTASCDISSSADLIVRTVSASKAITSSGNITGHTFFCDSSTGGYFFPSIGGGITVHNGTNIQIGASTHLEGAVTAALHFSGSGINNVLGRNVTLGDTCADSIYIKGSLTSSCGIQLGTSCSDSIVIKGTITSSCHISTSKAVFAEQYHADAQGYMFNNLNGGITAVGSHTNGTGYIQIGANTQVEGSLTASVDISGSGDLSITGQAFFGGNVTASQNISASGDIYGMDYYADNTRFVTGSFNPGGKLQIGNVDSNETRLVFDDSKWEIEAVASDPGYMSFHVNGSITASHSHLTNRGGIISASKNIMSATYQTHGKTFIASQVGTDNIDFADDSAIDNVKYGFDHPTKHNFIGHITASGGVSASGTNSIIGRNVTLGDSCADSIVVKGEITASCNISASGTGSFGHILTPTGTISTMTASYALSALTSSYVISSSYALSALTSSYAITASHALTASYVADTFKQTGQRNGNSAITGSLTISASGVPLLNIKGQISASNNINLKSTSGSQTNLGSPTNKGIIFQEEDLLLHTAGHASENVFLGRRAGNLSNKGRGNIGIGYSSSVSLTSGPTNNIGVGMNSNLKLTVGNRNVAIGDQALENNVSGDGNIAIGYQAGISETGNNKLYIGNDGAASSSIFLYGDMGDSAGTMGIGSSPSLHLKGRFTVSESISASGFLFSSSSLNSRELSVVVWDSGSGRYYHTGSYGQVGGLTDSNTFKGTGQRNGNSAITGSLTVGNITSSGTISANNGNQVIKSDGLYLNISENYISSAGNLYINSPKNTKIVVNKHELSSDFYIHNYQQSAGDYNPLFWADTYNKRVGIGITSSITPKAKAKLHVGGDGITDWFQSGGDFNPITGPFGDLRTSIYAENNISASGHLNIDTINHNWDIGTDRHRTASVLVIDHQTGRVYHTGSYGGGGGVSSGNTFKSTGTRNGNSFITGSLTLSLSGSTGGKLSIPETTTNGMGLIEFGGSTMLHNRGTSTLVLGENHPHSVAINYSTVVGHNNATGISGDYNQLFGYENMPNGRNTLGNTLIGTQHLSRYAPEEEGTGYNTIIGYNCFDSITGQGITAVGRGGDDGGIRINSEYNIGVGYKAGRSSTGGYNTFIGFEAGRDTTGSFNIAIGEGKRHGEDPHFRSLIEGDTRPRGFGEASGRARINNVLNLTPTGSLPEKTNSKMGDLCVIHERKPTGQHYITDASEAEAVLYFFTGLEWRTVNLS